MKFISKTEKRPIKMNNRRAVIGKAKIKFENKDAMIYPYCTYRKSESTLALYNVVFTYRNAREVAAKLPFTNHYSKTLPNYKILDERNNILLDSKWDNLNDYLET